MSASASRRNTISARVARLARKELRETLRDRRTIITLVLMPLLVYPLLSIAFQRFVLTTLPAQNAPGYRLGIADEDEARILLLYLAQGDKVLEHADKEQDTLQLDADDLKLPEFDIFITQDPAAAVKDRQIDLGVQIKRKDRVDLPAIASPALDIELIYDPKISSSREALASVERRIAKLNETYLKIRLQLARVSSRAHPVEAKRVHIDSSGSSISFPLATLVPFVLILTTITGAVYPAIDLTAGERERGTLEMLIAAPIPRMGLLIAKYVAVLTVAMLTALVNCLAMIVTVVSIGLSTQLFGDRGLTAELAIEFCGLLLLFAAFFSAVLLALTSFARSFKEAQAYLVPLMLASTAPGIFTMMNGVRLTPLLAITPLANIVLLARDLFEYNASPVLSLLVLCSTLVYAVLAILVAAKLFGSDAVLYGSPGSWADAFRPATVARSAPSIGIALLTLAILGPLLYLLSNWIAHQQTSMSLKMGFAAVVTLALFVGGPLFASRGSGLPFKQSLRIRKTSWNYYAAAVLLGLSLWPFAHELVLRQHEHGWFVLGSEKLDRAKDLLAQWQQIPLFWTLICVALVPAVAEELFFRGFLLAALLGAGQTTRMAVITSAAIFGLFHVIVMEGMLFERFLPTMFLGLVLGWIAMRSGSVLPGIVLHALHNGFVVVTAYYEKEITARGWRIEDQLHLPTLWFVSAAACIVVAVLLAYAVKPGSVQAED